MRKKRGADRPAQNDDKNIDRLGTSLDQIIKSSESKKSKPRKRDSDRDRDRDRDRDKGKDKNKDGDRGKSEVESQSKGKGKSKSKSKAKRRRNRDEVEPGEVKEDEDDETHTGGNEQQKKKRRMKKKEEALEDFLVVSDNDEDLEVDTSLLADIEHQHTRKIENQLKVFAGGRLVLPKSGSNFEDMIAEETTATEVGEKIKTLVVEKIRARNVAEKQLGISATDEFLEIPKDLIRQEQEQDMVINQQMNRNQPASLPFASMFNLGGQPELKLDEDDMPPWVSDEYTKKMILHNANTMQALHSEILAFEQFMNPTEEEHLARLHVLEAVKVHVRKLWHDAEVITFGSFATNLYLPGSDIDICVLNAGEPTNHTALFKLSDQLRRDSESFCQVTTISGAKVPILKIVSQEKATGGMRVKCDISFGQANGIGSVVSTLHFVKKYPALRPLLFVLKYYLQQKGFSQVYTGGIGSYTLIMMIVSHLELYWANYNSHVNLGTLLRDFFELYGRTFNYFHVGVHVDDTTDFFLKPDRMVLEPGRLYRLSIQDPLDPKNELGHGSFQIIKIREAFRREFNSLNRWQPGGSGLRDASTPLRGIITCDDMIMKRMRMLSLGKHAELDLSQILEIQNELVLRPTAHFFEDLKRMHAGTRGGGAGASTITPVGEQNKRKEQSGGGSNDKGPQNKKRRKN
eukprot:CAMPEP_0184694084 /NCGR_PEP_ID=MMETSP0313-20130426/2140_1 /TAXON_ID=2792 /ORGANISM="Porphyridium aerugineum, Strain SAG 1380-2" /LENGTH=686 /DNA_ID=CAMNT_0027152309 /DNA_START=64 /DNA_END=2124 /DNA_ORIENTATION=-